MQKQKKQKQPTSRKVRIQTAEGWKRSMLAKKSTSSLKRQPHPSSKTG